MDSRLQQSNSPISSLDHPQNCQHSRAVLVTKTFKSESTLTTSRTQHLDCYGEFVRPRGICSRHQNCLDFDPSPFFQRFGVVFFLPLKRKKKRKKKELIFISKEDFDLLHQSQKCRILGPLVAQTHSLSHILGWLEIRIPFKNQFKLELSLSCMLSFL